MLLLCCVWGYHLGYEFDNQKAMLGEAEPLVYLRFAVLTLDSALLIQLLLSMWLRRSMINGVGRFMRGTDDEHNICIGNLNAAHGKSKSFQSTKGESSADVFQDCFGDVGDSS